MSMTKLVLATIVFLGTVQLGLGKDSTQSKTATRVPVLLELFTSEGCSSCPPADQLLEKLNRDQPVPGAELIVLSEHVDYWNNQGWTDPYSSNDWSKRQDEYASQLGSDTYTPQLVIDGRAAVVGSNRAAVQNAIRESLRTPKIPLVVSAKREADQLEVHLEVGPTGLRKTAAVYLVFAADQARSHVRGGENAGRELEHVAVAQSLAKICNVTSGSGLQKDVRTALTRLGSKGNLRVVVFVQDPSTKRVLGAAEVRL